MTSVVSDAPGVDELEFEFLRLPATCDIFERADCASDRMLLVSESRGADLGALTAASV